MLQRLSPEQCQNCKICQIYLIFWWAVVVVVRWSSPVITSSEPGTEKRGKGRVVADELIAVIFVGGSGGWWGSGKEEEKGEGERKERVGVVMVAGVVVVEFTGAPTTINWSIVERRGEKEACIYLLRENEKIWCGCIKGKEKELIKSIPF